MNTVLHVSEAASAPQKVSRPCTWSYEPN